MRTDISRGASATFAANRAQGAVRFGVRLQNGVTRQEAESKALRRCGDQCEIAAWTCTR